MVRRNGRLAELLLSDQNFLLTIGLGVKYNIQLNDNKYRHETRIN